MPAPRVLANDTDIGGDPLHVAVPLSDTVSDHGAEVKLRSDGSSTFDPTARTCPLQNLAGGKSIDDTFRSFVGDGDTLPGDDGIVGVAVTIHVRGRDETGTMYGDATASGAIHSDGASPEVSGCVFRSSTAIETGGP